MTPMESNDKIDSKGSSCISYEMKLDGEIFSGIIGPIDNEIQSR
jgi:hypothetical protein